MKEIILHWFKNMKFVYFFAFYLATWLLTIYLFAILMPERLANNPIVTQFTTMAANLLSFLVGYFFGGVAEKAKVNQPTAVGNSQNTFISQKPENDESKD